MTAQAALHFLHYRFALIGPLLDAAEEALVQEPILSQAALLPLQGEIARLRACVAYNDDDAGAMLHWAEIARQKLRPEMQYAMGLADFFFTIGLHASGRDEVAVAFADHQLEAAGQYPASALRILLALCTIYYDRADVPALQRAVTTLQQVADRAGLVLSIAWGHQAQGWIHYQRNDLAAATSSFRDLVEIAPVAHGRALLDGLTGFTLVLLAQGEVEQALAMVDTLRTHLVERGMLAMLPVADALQQRIQLHSGSPAGLDWQYQAPPNFSIIFWEQPTLMQARTLLARGTAQDLVQAVALLVEVRARAAAHYLPRVQIQASALAALVYAAQGDETAALGALQEAVDIAAPGGALRLLADCGPGLACLLHKLLDVGVAPSLCAASPGCLRRFPPRAAGPPACS